MNVSSEPHQSSNTLTAEKVRSPVSDLKDLFESLSDSEKLTITNLQLVCVQNSFKNIIKAFSVYVNEKSTSIFVYENKENVPLNGHVL